MDGFFPGFLAGLCISVLTLLLTSSPTHKDAYNAYCTSIEARYFEIDGKHCCVKDTTIIPIDWANINKNN